MRAKDFIVTAAVAVLVGFVWGALFAHRANKGARDGHTDAMTALELAADSTLRLNATLVEFRDAEPDADTVVRVIVRTVVTPPDTVTLDNTVREVRVDTVIVSADGLLKWAWGDTTAAYRLTGQSVANLINPQLSFTDYNLKIYRERLIGRTYRVSIAGGIVAGRPTILAPIRIYGRWSIMPGVAFESAGDELVKPRTVILGGYNLW